MYPECEENNIVGESFHARRLSVVLTDIFILNNMKPFLQGDICSTDTSKGKGYLSDDESVRYKINTKLMKEITKKATKIRNAAKTKAKEGSLSSVAKARRRSMDDCIRYKFPESKPVAVDNKNKATKTKLKVNFWSSSSRNKLKFLDTSLSKKDVRKPLNRSSKIIQDNSVNQIIKITEKTPQKTVKLQAINTNQVTPTKPIKKVSFLPSPLFSDQHAPMVTVPDDITLNFNTDGSCNYLPESIDKFVNHNVTRKRTSTGKPKTTQTNPNSDVSDIMCNSESGVTVNNGEKEKCYDNELEYFSKYIVQKLRKMDTNQRIYGENLINTVIMLGQLGQLNRKTKVQNIEYTMLD